MEIVFLIIGLVAGAAIGWFFARTRYPSSDPNTLALLQVEHAKLQQSQEQVIQLKTDLEIQRQQVIELSKSRASMEADSRNLLLKLTEQKLEMESLIEKSALQFKSLANEIFDDKSKKFADQNRTSLLDLLRPLGDKIVEFEKRVDDTHKDTISRNSALREQLESLQRLNLQMTREAENLTRALKGDSKTQGAWGEFILESILEKSGLEKDREYVVQESFTTGEGRLRPDIIVRLPGRKHVVIDSKVSLTAYNNFVNAANDEDQAIALKAHILSIRQHLKGLAEKKYQNISPAGLDFIIMFIPIEPAYILAIQREPKLYEEALEKKIVFISPTLLIPSLQLIKASWKNENQNRNVLEIATKAGDLYDKFVGFTEDLVNLGRHLDNAKKMYEESMKKLSVGSGNLVRKSEELKKMGAKTSKIMDPKLLVKSEEQQDLFEQ